MFAFVSSLLSSLGAAVLQWPQSTLHPAQVKDHDSDRVSLCSSSSTTTSTITIKNGHSNGSQSSCSSQSVVEADPLLCSRSSGTNDGISKKCDSDTNGVSNPLFRGRYEIDSRTGFVPWSAPVTALPPPFDRWERALAAATSNVKLAEAVQDVHQHHFSHSWRTDLAALPLLETSVLEADPGLLRRAHHVLAFLVHFYVHSTPNGSNPAIVIPASVAVPLVRVSRVLGIAPVLTFADTVLWNHEIVDGSGSSLTRANIRPLTLFTGSSDEANFYGCCAEIELRGVEALRAIASFYDMASVASWSSCPEQRQPLCRGEGRGRNDNGDDGEDVVMNHDNDEEDDAVLDRARDCLKTVAGVIDDLSAILQSVREICDPHAFYFAVRPWFRGSDAAGPVGEQQQQQQQQQQQPQQRDESSSSRPRWVYEGVSEEEHRSLELSGPSAGQSSIVHTLDIFLDVDHDDKADSSPSSPSPSSGMCPHAKSASTKAPSTTTTTSSPNGEFMNRMRRYMPGSHHEFLEQLTALTHAESRRRSIRELARRHPEALMGPYNDAVLALKRFRDLHIRIACLYVVSMSRKGNGIGSGGMPHGAGGGAATGMGSMCPAMRQRQQGPVRGTGGNELSLLLKSCRDATTRTLLQQTGPSS